MSGSGVGGRAAGSWDGQISDWSSFTVAADGNAKRSVQLTVPYDEEPGVDEWDVQCIEVPGTPFYPFTSMEVVPAGTLPTTAVTTAPTTSSSSAPGTSTRGTPTTAARAAATVTRPSLPG